MSDPRSDRELAEELDLLDQVVSAMLGPDTEDRLIADLHLGDVRPGFTCPVCSRTSYHPTDLAEGYCGACHAFTGDGGPPVW